MPRPPANDILAARTKDQERGIDLALLVDSRQGWAGLVDRTVLDVIKTPATCVMAAQVVPHARNRSLGVG